MKNKNTIIWGFILIVVGVLLGGKAIGIFNFDIFFHGWWTLFIIIPCLVGLIKDDNKISSLIGIIIGVLLLLACQDVIEFKLVWKLMIPIIIVGVGLSMILRSFVNREIDKEFKKIKRSNVGEGVTAVFSGQDIKIDDEEFKGTELTAVFGGVELDLRKAIIKEDVVIDAVSIFGGITIYVSDDIKVVVKSNSVFGGVSNNKKVKDDKKARVVYVNANCVFGGLDIK